MSANFAFLAKPNTPHAPSLLRDLPTVTDQSEVSQYHGYFYYNIENTVPFLSFAAVGRLMPPEIPVV